MEQEGQDSAVALPGRRIDQGPLSADGVGEEPGLLRAEDRQGHRTEIGAEGTREAPDAVCSSPEAVIHSRSMTNGYTPGSKLIAHGGQNSTRADSLGILRQMERVDPDAQRLAGAIVSTPSWEGARMPRSNRLRVSPAGSHRGALPSSVLRARHTLIAAAGKAPQNQQATNLQKRACTHSTKADKNVILPSVSR